MRNYTVGEVWDIPIRINVSLLIFLPVLAWLIGSGTQIETYATVVTNVSGVPIDVALLREGITPWIVGTAAAVGLFVSVALHELGHSWAGMRYGLRTESITLWILGGLASFETIPREWKKELGIAVAGPATSVLVAVVSYAVVVAVGRASTLVAFTFGWLAVTNVILAVFNMLPAFPMDGGRVLRALLARSQSYATATRTAARVGVVFALLFAVVGVLAFSPILLLLAFFVYGGATTESRTVVLDDLLDGLTVGDVASKDVPTVDVDGSIADLFARILDTRETAFTVSGYGAIVGAITLADMKQVKPTTRPTVTIGDIATRDLPRIDRETDAFDALATLDQRRSTLALVESEGEVIGLLRREDYAQTMQFRQLQAAE